METNKSIEFWRGFLPILASFIACGLIGLLSWQWFVIGCMWWECVDSGYFDSQTAQNPREYFPGEAVYGNLGLVHESDGARQREAQTIYWGEHNNSMALLHVSRFPGTSSAKKSFAFDVRISREMFDIPSEQSDESTYQSISADQLFIGCGKEWTPWGRQCVFVARYDEDLISLNMSIDEQMALKDFERIVIYLDSVSAKRLGH